MAVPNQFVISTTGSSALVPLIASTSTTSADAVTDPSCECGFPLAEVVSLAGVCLLAAICLGIHLARVIYYVLYGAGADIFMLDR
jgi:hypothetical protein